MMLKIWAKARTDRRPVDLLGHTGYATDEGALLPWPVVHYLLEELQATRDYLHELTEEIKRWHNQIPDGEERVETIRRRHENAARPLEQVVSVHEAAARAEARARGESVPLRRRR